MQAWHGKAGMAGLAGVQAWQASGMAWQAGMAGMARQAWHGRHGRQGNKVHGAGGELVTCPSPPHRDSPRPRPRPSPAPPRSPFTDKPPSVCFTTLSPASSAAFLSFLFRRRVHDFQVTEVGGGFRGEHP